MKIPSTKQKIAAKEIYRGVKNKQQRAIWELNSTSQTHMLPKTVVTNKAHWDLMDFFIFLFLLLF